MTQSQIKSASDSNVANEQASGLSVRRRKLLGGVAASPLLLTVASRPVWAQGGMCTPSALASANLSGQYEFVGCGISAGWWKQKQDRWPASTPPTTLFHSIFPKTKFDKNVIYEKKGVLATTLGGVINGNFDGTDPGNLAMHLIGAYLNAISFPKIGEAPGYRYTAQEVVELFKALDSKSKSEFETLKNLLERANNDYDSSTQKP